MMTTRLRSVKVDENEAQQKSKKMIQSSKMSNTAAGQQKRAALGELGNRAVVKSGDLQKDTALLLKNAKARVDSHWKKPEMFSYANTKGVKVQKAPTVSGKIANEIKALKPRGARTKSNVEEKQTSQVPNQQQLVVLPQAPILRREESNVPRRSLSKLKAVLCKEKKGVLICPPPARVEVASVAPIVAAPAAPASSSTAHPKAIEVKCKVKAHSSSLLDEVANIDAGDSKNPILVSEYANDIYSYLFQLESEMPIRKAHLDKQIEVTQKMRSVLLDWINEVHFQFRLLPETYHLTVAIIDRYLQEVPTTERQHLQLVGIGALFIASKYEELYPPEIRDFVYIADDTYTKEQILTVEQKIMKTIDFNLGRPSSIHFLRRFSKAASPVDETHMLAKYIIELASIDYTLAHYRPSEIAAGALFLALKLFRKNANLTDEQLWTNTLKFYTTYTVSNLLPLVKKLATLLKSASTAQLKAVYVKYQSSKFDKIACRSELSGPIVEKLISE